MKANNGEDAQGELRTDAEPTRRCNCWTCSEARRKAAVASGDWDGAMAELRMHTCPVCGNKRCPKATDHRHACTNSNEPGQRGSRY